MIRGQKPLLGAAALTAAMFLVSAGSARAQTTQSQPPSQQQQAQGQSPNQGYLSSSQIDDQTLEQFTRSYLAISDIQQKEKDQLASEPDQAKVQAIKKDANQRMMKVLDDHKLTVEKFNQILQSIPKDQELGKRFIAMQSRVVKG
ncbi:MAG TPA: DUF4168 domain-containing protein [Vicinamibacterales bacterium]|jgi:hypothetical protein